MQRVPEPELMLDEEQARAYAAADFQQPHARFIELLTQKLPGLPLSGHALDLGCGPGDIARRFSRAFRSWTVDAVDGSPAMLEIARQHNMTAGLANRIELHQQLLPADWEPQRDLTLIFSNSLLHHLNDPQVLWAGIKRWAQQNTDLFVMDLLRPPSPEQAAALVDQYAATEPAVLRHDFYNSLLAAYSIAEIRAQLQSAGLDHLSLEIVSDRHFIIWGTVDAQ